MTAKPDIFSNVHKGIRKALFEACTSLGRASSTQEVEESRSLVRQVLHFVQHHGANEDELLLPLLRSRLPHICQRMTAGHEALSAAVASLASRVEAAPGRELYQDLCSLTARYLEHLREEELEFAVEIHAALTREELQEFSRRAVERTSPADQRVMLGWMMRALTAPEVDALLARVPAPAAEELRRLANAAS